jgi:hypothetical protein
MNLKVFVQGAGEATAQGVKDWCQFFENEASKVGVSAAALDNIIIYDEANVGPAYQYVGAPTPIDRPRGHTVSKMVGNDVKCSILFPLETFYALEGMRDNRPPAHPPNELQRYVLSHELGHCRDDLTRSDLRSPRIQPTDPYDAQTFASKTAQIARSEYVACRFAAASVGQSLYSWVENETFTDWQAFRGAATPNVPNNRRAGGLSVRISEYAKLAGHRAGNPVLSSQMQFDPEFYVLENLLALDWETYPGWSTPEPEGYFELWQKFCANLHIS